LVQLYGSVRPLLSAFQPTAFQADAVQAPLASPILSSPRFATARKSAHVSAETLVAPDAAFDQLLRPALGEDAPDGLTAIPLVLDRISPTRRRELNLWVGVLLVETLVFLQALSTDQARLRDLIDALVPLAFLWAAFFNAIDEASERPREEEDE
jgi:hypothetical protein